MRRLVLALAPGNLIVFNGLELALNIDAIQPRDIAADDLLLDLVGKIDTILGLQVLRETESHKFIKLPVRIPDGKIGPVNNAIRAKPEEQIRQNLGEVARTPMNKGKRHRQGAVDIR